MALLRNTMTMAFGLAGALTLSQAPEFAQQYRQRLGGALTELQRSIADFDADAARSGMTRPEALALHEGADEPLFRDRGRRMERTIERYQTLNAQAAWFAELPPAARPIAVARGYDGELLGGVFDDYEPAVPLTLHGIAWAAIGFLAGAAILLFVTWPYARWRRRRRQRRTTSRNGVAA